MRGKRFLTPEYEGSLEVSQDLLVAGFIGISGTLNILTSRADILSSRFSQGYLDACRDLKNHWVDARVMLDLISRDANSTFAAPLGEEGIMAGLWHMAEFFQKGLTVDLKKIPVRQETIEVTEVFDLNPYRLQSAGSFLLAANHGQDMVVSLGQAGIFAMVVGKVEAGIGRRILHDGSVSFLDRPGGDELMKI